MYLIYFSYKTTPNNKTSTMLKLKKQFRFLLCFQKSETILSFLESIMFTYLYTSHEYPYFPHSLN